MLTSLDQYKGTGAAGAPGGAGRERAGNGTAHPPARPRILMMGGDDYVGQHPSFVSMVNELEKSGRYALSGFGLDGWTPSPSLQEQVFEATTDFPTVQLRPRTLNGALALTGDLVRSLIRRWNPANRAVLEPPAGLARRARFRRRMLQERLARDVPRATKGYDLYHWHTLELERLAAMAFVPLNAKLVLTPWGSDLLRTAGIDAYKRQLWACNRASRIVVYSLELREILLTKFGRHLLPKMRLASIGGGLFDSLELARTARRTFLESAGIPNDKVIVCIGNNGSPSNQHLPILNSLNQLSEELRQRIVVLLPMTYGTPQAYLPAVENAVASATYDVRILRKRMTDFDTACLRAATDILVFVPTTDSLSAALCEVLAAGGIAVTGAWLPYGLIRRHGVHFHEIADLGEAPGRLAAILENLDVERVKASATGPRVKDLKAWDRVVNQWIEIYDELLSEAER